MQVGKEKKDKTIMSLLGNRITYQHIIYYCMLAVETILRIPCARTASLLLFVSSFQM